MTFAYFAGRSTLRHLHRQVHQNISRQHRFNVRHESTGSGKSGSNGGGSSSNTTTTTTTTQQSQFTGAYWAWLSPIRIPIRAYNNMQARSPLITQWETTLVIYFIGDVCAQTVQTNLYSEGRYEPLRGLRALLIGGIISIPSYKWFLWLGRNFNYSSHLLSLGVKILVSQCLFTPLFNSYFFGMQSLLTGNGLWETVERVKKTVPVSWMNSWKLWPAVTAFSFTFVRPQNRSVFAGFVAIFWQTYLSWLNRKAEVAEKSAKMGVSSKAEKAIKGSGKSKT